MPPNKVKLYKNKKPSTSQQNVPQENAHSDAPEASNQEQFEIELYWCIHQLQKALSLGKLNNKQVQDHTKALNVLMSNTAPVIKKRQVMRLSFGDYREKMAAEEKKASKNAAKMNMKSAVANKKTVFLKKSLFTSSVDNDFKFDFNIEEKMEDIAVTDTPKSTNKVNFTKSDNTFMFNFQTDNDT
ncbi:unnamed protein product [Phyllotreta striolata]|uniref:Uncharacterized protein n=1 Tax=Phyllotreta striolata TaxID=444603 RepID=A0A9N9TZQ8_PHYSR|nr:unnamed protein product [Phyllotreta striolata]